tara:strand:- start:4 stop:447 length:444 start_codon:yes stop_codon:yes gene_type:complete
MRKINLRTLINSFILTICFLYVSFYSFSVYAKEYATYMCGKKEHAIHCSRFGCMELDMTQRISILDKKSVSFTTITPQGKELEQILNCDVTSIEDFEFTCNVTQSSIKQIIIFSDMGGIATYDPPIKDKRFSTNLSVGGMCWTLLEK